MMAASAIIYDEQPPQHLVKDFVQTFESFGFQEKEELFLNFLCDEAINLHYVYEFRYAVAGLRTRLSNHKNDLENYMTAEGKKLVKLIWKRYFKSVENSFVDEVIFSRIKKYINNGELHVEIYDEAFEKAETILKSLVISFVKTQSQSLDLWNWYNDEFNPGRGKFLEEFNGISINPSTELLLATLSNLPNDYQNQLFGEGEYYKIVTKKRFPIDENEDEKEYNKKVQLILKKRAIGIDKLINFANYKDPARPKYSSKEPNKLSPIQLIEKQFEIQTKINEWTKKYVRDFATELNSKLQKVKHDQDKRFIKEAFNEGLRKKAKERETKKDILPDSDDESILTDHVAKNFDDTKRIDPDGISLHHENIYSSRNRIVPSNPEMMRPMSSQSQNRCLQWAASLPQSNAKIVHYEDNQFNEFLRQNAKEREAKKEILVDSDDDESILTDHVSKTFDSKRIHSDDPTKTPCTIHKARSHNSLTHQRTKSKNHSFSSIPQVIITINEGDTFIVQIPKPPQSAITLNDLKNRMPIKGDYRYFIKDYMDGEACFVEMITDVQILPVFEGKIIVKCKSI